MFEKVHGTADADNQVLPDEIPDRYLGNSLKGLKGRSENSFTRLACCQESVQISPLTHWVVGETRGMIEQRSFLGLFCGRSF